MTRARMNHLFAASGSFFDVAIDHGMFNEASFLGGIKDMHAAICTIAAAPDASQLLPGTAKILQFIPGKSCTLTAGTQNRVVPVVYGAGS